ncbi:MAG: matrixin family metalloprotease [Thaumarchaeota archaeon]|nr:matrixin family metalloprotease [Nitrososphaerota archaeon]
MKISSDDDKDTKQFESEKIKEIEQEKIFLKDINDLTSSKVDELGKSNQELEKKLDKELQKSKELEQEKIILEEIVHDGEKSEQKSHKRYYISVSIIAVVVSLGFVGYSYYENQAILKATSHDMSNYNSNYVIQNLQGDTVDTWVSWNIQNDRVIHIHVVNEAQVSQDMINAMEDAITSNKAVSIDDSQTGKGPQGSSSTYYVGWEGADAQAYSEPTKLYVPQKFDINGSPDGVGDIEIILTNDVNPDGYSGWTKSIVDGHEILKSKITIFKASKLDPDRLEAIMRHEFGHALGLGHSTASEDLMHPMLPDYPYISDCDIDALKGLYDGDQNSKVVCKK